MVKVVVDEKIIRNGYSDVSDKPPMRDNKELVELKGVGPLYCPACGSEIHFVKTVNSKMMPCEMDLRRGDYKRTLVTHQGVTMRKPGPEIAGYEPHWGFCRGANGFKTGRSIKCDGVIDRLYGGAK
jgi:hypothetical protein